MPVWQQEVIQQATTNVETLTQKLREYSTATESEKPATPEELNAITAAMVSAAYITKYAEENGIDIFRAHHHERRFSGTVAGTERRELDW